MKQIGTVVETDGIIAKIECDRRSACDMCENSEGCTVKCQKAYTRALNPLNAQVGDTVEIEAEDGRVLGTAFTVFALPILLSVIFYFVSSVLFGEAVAIPATLLTLILSLVLLSRLLNKSAEKNVTSRIVKIL